MMIAHLISLFSLLVTGVNLRITRTRCLHERMNAMDLERQTQAIDEPAKKTFNTDMIHSDEEVLRALQQLIGHDNEGNPLALQPHETMVLYRNVRKKYSSSPEEIRKSGICNVSTFRTAEEGLKATYRASLCRDGLDREASALYVCINPRHVADAMTLTHANYIKWLEGKAGITKNKVRGWNREDYAGFLDTKLAVNIMATQSRRRLDMIDVDDPTWLPRIKEAIGNHVEMIVDTKNGYHVVYHGKKMEKQQHLQLQKVLMESPKGTLEKVSRSKGTSVACALPGGSLSYHKTKIIYSAWDERKSPPLELAN